MYTIHLIPTIQYTIYNVYYIGYVVIDNITILKHNIFLGS